MSSDVHVGTIFFADETILEPPAPLLELAKRKGLRTGDVTTSEIQDATPAVQVSHVTERRCYGPVDTTADCPTDALENGGRGSITEQLLRSRPDVTLGGGAATFAETATAGRYQGRTLLEQADARGYLVVRTASELADVGRAAAAARSVRRRQPPGEVGRPGGHPRGCDDPGPALHAQP
jgi:alkaline phosphatase